MSPLAIVAIAFAMSTDAFAAAIGKGAAMGQPRASQALLVGAIFGGIAALATLVGWLLGRAAAEWLRDWDHWVAFLLLAGLGVRMIWMSLQPDSDDEAIADAVAESPDRDAGVRTGTGSSAGSSTNASQTGTAMHSALWLLAATGLATSIDATAVGASLALVETPIAAVALAIGAATLLMSAFGVLLGRVLGAMIGKRAEIVGGVVLIVVGALILNEHLSGRA